MLFTTAEERKGNPLMFLSTVLERVILDDQRNFLSLSASDVDEYLRKKNEHPHGGSSDLPAIPQLPVLFEGKYHSIDEYLELKRNRGNPSKRVISSGNQEISEKLDIIGISDTDSVITSDYYNQDSIPIVVKSKKRVEEEEVVSKKRGEKEEEKMKNFNCYPLDLGGFCKGKRSVRENKPSSSVNVKKPVYPVTPPLIPPVSVRYVGSSSGEGGIWNPNSLSFAEKALIRYNFKGKQHVSERIRDEEGMLTPGSVPFAEKAMMSNKSKGKQKVSDLDDDYEYGAGCCKKRKQKRIVNGGSKKKGKMMLGDCLNPPPGLPIEFKEAIENMGGSDVTLVIQKAITATDASHSHNRLSVPVSQAGDAFLNDREKEDLKLRDVKGLVGISVPVFLDPCLRVWTTISFRKWDMVKRKTGGKTSSSYSLCKTWNFLCERNGLKPEMVVQLWSFRVQGRLSFALVNVSRELNKRSKEMDSGASTSCSHSGAPSSPTSPMDFGH